MVLLDHTGRYVCNTLGRTFLANDPRIVGKDRVLSKRDETHRMCRRTVRPRDEREGGEKHLLMLTAWRRRLCDSKNNGPAPPKPSS